ncbi:hypothetical protein WA158_001168 [Blastocystis sp. Blastoise]
MEYSMPSNRYNNISMEQYTGGEQTYGDPFLAYNEGKISPFDRVDVGSPPVNRQNMFHQILTSADSSPETYSIKKVFEYFERYPQDCDQQKYAASKFDPNMASNSFDEVASEISEESGGDDTQSSIVFISNLPPENIYPRHIFNVFSCFGEVLRVKIMHTDRTKALVKFPSHSQAQKAVIMDGVMFKGHELKVRLSTTTHVDAPFSYACPTIRDLTEDFYGKLLHRFTSTDYMKIPEHEPTNHVHVVGIDDTIPDIQMLIKALFGRYGKIIKIKFVKNMCWIEYDSVESAVNAIAFIHNTSSFAKEGKLLRVSFATYRSGRKNSKSQSRP